MLKQFIVYAIPETRPGRTTRPLVVVRVEQRATRAGQDAEWARSWDSINCEAIQPLPVTATGAADARRLYRAAAPGADQRTPGGI